MKHTNDHDFVPSGEFQLSGIRIKTGQLFDEVQQTYNFGYFIIIILNYIILGMLYWFGYNIQTRRRLIVVADSEW